MFCYICISFLVWIINNVNAHTEKISNIILNITRFEFIIQTTLFNEQNKQYNFIFVHSIQST